MGRPRKPIDGEIVRKLAKLGCTDREIGMVMGVSQATIKLRCRRELDEGRAELRKSLRAAQIKLALGGSVPMLIWLGKQYLEQRERQDVVYSGEETRVVERIVSARSDSSAT